MDEKEPVVRAFYSARDRRDWENVRQLLAPDVAWREADGEQSYSGAHHGRETVVALLEKFVEITGGTFRLEPIDVICTADHAATNVRWRAERNGTRAEGNDLAVFRIADGQIAEAWFFPDGYDPRAVSEVFAFAAGQ